MSHIPRLALPRKSIAALAFLLLAAGVLLDRVPALVGLAYCLMSILAILLYAVDKTAAEHGRWRTPERTLHLVSLLGGWPGALLAQDILHHKTRKTAFQLVFWASVALNCCALAWLLIAGPAAYLDHIIRGV